MFSFLTRVPLYVRILCVSAFVFVCFFFMSSGADPNPLFLKKHSLHCGETDFSKVAVVNPEEWIASGVHNGPQLLNFKLALPPASVSWITDLMVQTGGVWAPVETMIFIYILRNPEVRKKARLVVDVGANLGYFSEVTLSMGYEVLAFEPQRRAQPYLAATATHNNYTKKFHLHACAVGGDLGSITMSDSPKWEVSQNEGLSSPGSPGAVPQVRLSDMLIPGIPIALLKIDTEGYEAGVFAGLAVNLLPGIMNVVVEIKKTENRIVIMKMLGEAGFFCKMYVEKYFTVFPRSTEDALKGMLAEHLAPCTYDVPGEDFWFSRQEFVL